MWSVSAPEKNHLDWVMIRPARRLPRASCSSTNLFGVSHNLVLIWRRFQDTMDVTGNWVTVPETVSMLNQVNNLTNQSNWIWNICGLADGHPNHRRFVIYIFINGQHWIWFSAQRPVKIVMWHLILSNQLHQFNMVYGQPRITVTAVHNWIYV